MGMFISRPALGKPEDLDQGDLLVGVLQPQLQSALFAQRDGPKMRPADEKDIGASDLSNLRLNAQLRVIDLALVISNSCDNFAGAQLLLVPVTPFKFSDRASDDAGRWMEISKAATGGASPRTFYLPADESLGIARSQARLDQIFPLSAKQLGAIAKSRTVKRIAGLTTEAVRHLQWALSFFFSRNAREDLQWPSTEDLRLKAAWLESMIDRGFKGEYAEALAQVKSSIADAEASNPEAQNKTGT